MIILGLSAGVASCNSDSETLEYEVPSSAIVKSFSFSEDSKTLDNLDKVFFSIDLANGRIFNADSMPYGTKTDKLVPVITTGGASGVELIVPRPGKSDTTYNYLTNSTDSIDFSNGAVTLKLVSPDESVTMSYTINVNVHQVKSDSLCWGSIAYTSLPTTLSNVTAQHALKFKGKAYCLTTDGQSYCLSTSDNPGNKMWDHKAVNFGFIPQTDTFRASSESLYILDVDGKMYKSDDFGVTWTPTGLTCDYLIGGYADRMIGTKRNGNTWSIVSTDGSTVAAPEGFPVRNASVPLEYGFPMSDSRQMTIVGGRTATGSLVAGAWGYDGSSWAYLTSKPLPEGLEETTVTPYYTFEENAYWVATKESIFVVIGGRNAKGESNDSTYISYNYGMSWQKAPELMQLSKTVPGMACSQTLVFSSMLGSRASSAITSWECPYIYMFGGYDENDRLYNTVWRGVINRLSFKPLQ